MLTYWIQLMLVITSAHRVWNSGSERHSLWALITCISGFSELPECNGVLLLDDLQVAYGDTTLNHLVSNSWERTPVDLGPDTWLITWDTILDMRKQLSYTKYRLNLTQGTVVQQRIVGCEIEDGEPTIIMSRDGYNGHDSDSLMYNMTHFTFTAKDGFEARWNAARWPIVQNLFHHIYLPKCVSLLRQLLVQKNNLVNRRVRPRFRIFSKRVKGGAQITCLATDFYPRNINVTLLRDGHQVEEDQLTIGPVLPNANGLYQVRMTLALTDKELQEKHNYTCTATHSSLDNRLQVSWKAESYEAHQAQLISPMVVAAMVLLLALILKLAKCWKRQALDAHRETLGAESIVMVNGAEPREDGS